MAKANADAESATARAWAVLEQVPDPEVPVVSVCDLGIVRDVAVQGQGVAVVLTPTYSGCPATEVIAQSVHDALAGAGFDPVTVSTRRAPAWTTDWISDAGRRKLRAYGIAPPSGNAAVHDDGPRPIRIHARGVDCPRCGSSQTEKLSAFGSTACKALYRCLACREPFEYFKPI
ncbi:MAG: phenylacetate-CoA oxygenase subunit PaaJ [Rubrivivax sp.]|nr:phenylacetate-CoA oxygenase subunit PaaJ [Rubrivivax sp.]MBK7262329.1 phenylacetate-CoA oxygenase subunit PaaJ [Rubrivivax sp.]MBK8528551.1 phenylacetate-CoA oxygenase subunit PaaJ [Rubrivivax sp.]